MTRFSDLGIKVNHKGFQGEKVKISKVLNRDIMVHDYKLDDSKFEGKGKCLQMQIELNGTMHVIFTGSVVLIDLIEQVPKAKFPFSTTIVEDNERFFFT